MNPSYVKIINYQFFIKNNQKKIDLDFQNGIKLTLQILQKLGFCLQAGENEEAGWYCLWINVVQYSCGIDKYFDRKIQNLTDKIALIFRIVDRETLFRKVKSFSVFYINNTLLLTLIDAYSSQSLLALSVWEAVKVRRQNLSFCK